MEWPPECGTAPASHEPCYAGLDGHAFYHSNCVAKMFAGLATSNIKERGFAMPVIAS
jgi:hypothetical protein